MGGEKGKGVGGWDTRLCGQCRDSRRRWPEMLLWRGAMPMLVPSALWWRRMPQLANNPSHAFK